MVDHRVHDRKLALRVQGRQAIEVHRAGVEVAAVPATREVNLREDVIRGDEPGQIVRLQVSQETVIVEIVLVR